MNATRGFLTIGSLYIIIGVSIGIYMSGASDYKLTPLHVHINLLGFVLPAVFAITYHLFPAAGTSALARLHFWLHSIGAVVLLVMLGALLLGKIPEAAMFPVAPIAELAILIGLVLYAVNMFRHAR